MVKRILIWLAAGGLFLAGSLLLLRQYYSRDRANAGGAGQTPVRVSPHPRAAVALPEPHPGEKVRAPAPHLANPPGDTAARLAVDASKRATVVAALEELKSLYADAGTLSWEETKALISK